MRWLEDCGVADRFGVAFRLFAFVVVAVALIAAPAQAAEPPVPPGTDYWKTISGQFDFATNPIPANFFGPGSDPFIGPVQLEGNPLNFGSFGDADTLVERLDEVDPPPFPAETTVDIEILALSLTSIAPIEVNESSGTSLWDVSVELDPTTPMLGQLEITKTDANGGTFSTQLQVQPRFTFTKVGDPWDIRVFDRDDNLLPPIPLVSAVDADWSYLPPIDPELIPPPARTNQLFLNYLWSMYGDEFTWTVRQAEMPPVPEPGSFAVLALGLAGMIGRKRRK